MNDKVKLSLVRERRLKTKELHDRLKGLTNEIIAVNGLDDNFNVEAHAKLVYTMLYIANKTKSKSLKKICLLAIDDSDKKSLEDLAKYHRDQGINLALTEIEKKIQLAKELKSDITMVVGESYHNHIKKLLT